MNRWGHKWADYAEPGYGAALLNDCKYGYDIHDGVMSLTLLKASNRPDDHADQGTHTFTYALFPHSGEWYQAAVDQGGLGAQRPAPGVPGGDSAPWRPVAGGCPRRHLRRHIRWPRTAAR